MKIEDALLKSYSSALGVVIVVCLIIEFSKESNLEVEIVLVWLSYEYHDVMYFCLINHNIKYVVKQ